MFNQTALLVIFFMTFGIITFSCSKDNGDTEPVEVVLPKVSILDASTIKTKNNTTLLFYVSLDKKFDKEVSFDYFLSNGTAIATEDFEAKQGTVIIPIGQNSTNIEVIIIGAESYLREPNLTFNVILSNPKNCTFSDNTGEGVIITEDGTHLPTDNTGYSTPNSYPGYTLTWNDEFTGGKLNEATWNYEMGNGIGGWGNNELEYYTNNSKNIFLSEGNLIIEARKEAANGFNYTSSRITTKDKKEFTFGRIDIRAKLPKGKGIWPALWMLGANISEVGWPVCGEIDIMELVGHEAFRSHGTLHWKPISGTNDFRGSFYDLSGTDFSKEFHVFSIEWEEDIIKWFVDDVKFFTMTKTNLDGANYPFNAPQFFIFNVAVGGNWPGSPDNTTIFPQRMFVDYVRVFQK